MNNNWINHIKQYALKNNIKYSEALKDPNAKASYGGSLKSDTVKRILHFNKEHFNPFDVYKPSKDIQSMILSGYTKGQYTDQNFNVAIANERNKEHIKLLKELWKTAKDNKNKKTVTLKSTPNYDELLNDVGNMKKIKTNKTSNNEDEKEKKKLDLRKGRMQKKIADWRRRLPRYWSNDADIYEGTSNASIEKLIQMEKEALDEVIKYEAEQERSNLNDVRNTKKIKTNKKTVTLKNIPNHDQLLNDVGNMKQIKVSKKQEESKSADEKIEVLQKQINSDVNLLNNKQLPVGEGPELKQVVNNILYSVIDKYFEIYKTLHIDNEYVKDYTLKYRGLPLPILNVDQKVMNYIFDQLKTLINRYFEQIRFSDTNQKQLFYEALRYEFQRNYHHYWMQWIYEKEKNKPFEDNRFALKKDLLVESILRKKQLIDKPNLTEKEVNKMNENQISELLKEIRMKEHEINIPKALEKIKSEFEYWSDTNVKKQSSYNSASYIFETYMQEIYFNPILKGKEKTNERVNLIKSILPQQMPSKIKTYFTGDNKFTREVVMTSDGFNIINEIIDWFSETKKNRK